MATAVEDLRNRLRVVSKDIKDLSSSYGPDNLPDIEAEAKLDGMINAKTDLVAALQRAEKFDAAGASADREATPPPVVSRGAEDRQKILSLGARFVQSEDYKAALQRYAPDGRIPERGNFSMPGFSFKGLSELSAALVTGGDPASSGGAFLIPDRQAGYVELGRRPLRIRDIVRVLQTSADLIEYVAQTGRTNNAGFVPEATAASGGSGVKPESGFTFEVRQAPVKTIANWMPVTKQAVSDVPQLRGIIDTEVRDNLDYEVDDQMVNGAGGIGITGILNTSGRQMQSWSTNILTTLRKAKTIASTVGRVIPEAYVLNPADWETIDLLQDNEGRYFYGGPAAIMTPRLWGLPVVESEAVPTGTGLTGAFTKCILWDREQASLSVSDSHADFFIRNLLALLAELRAGFALTQPTAIVEIDLTA